MAGIAAFRNVWQVCVIRPFCRAALKDEASIAIAAIDITVLVNFKEDARMAQRSGAITLAAANGACAVATDAALFDQKDFRRRRVHSLEKLRARHCKFNRV